MADVKTIDQRIRDRAAKELTEELRLLAAPLRNRLGHATGIALRVEGKVEGRAETLYAPTIIDSLVDKLFAAELPARTDRAIDEFLRRVEDLQSQLDEVRELTGV